MAKHYDDQAAGANQNLPVKLDAQGAMERLLAGNASYLAAAANEGDISQNTRQLLFDEGQAPFACVVSCADSRVVPEHIFMAGLGELFCIRVAGNVIGDMEAASCVYAAEHLHVPLIVVLGHTQCGAVGAALEAVSGDASEESHALAPLVSRIACAIGDETDSYAASVANTRVAAETLRNTSELRELIDSEGLSVCGALYHTDSGRVEFLEG